MTARSAPAGPPSWPRLISLLALTTLPVPLTSGALWLFGATGTIDAVRPWLRTAYLALATYAAASWIVLGVILTIEGGRLADHGLRFTWSRARFIQAAAGFAAGVAIYGVVDAVLGRLGLPRVAGMEFRAPTAAEVAVLVFSPVVSAPVCEEIFYRVVWIGVLGTRLPVRFAATLSVAAFAAIHYPYFGTGGVIFISMWSIVPVVLFVRWRDLTAPLTMHLMNNTFAYLVVPLLLSH